MGSKVVDYYNQSTEVDLSRRANGRIYHLRNFSNWVKGTLIKQYSDKVRKDQYSNDLQVLDVGCGKGGDLLKWKFAGISHLSCVDISETAIQLFKKRYFGMLQKSENLFKCDFLTGDCGEIDLSKEFDNFGQFAITSCQFVIHYSFESYERALMMIKNCCDGLRTGGFFIGTTNDAYEIVSRFRSLRSNHFGNDIYNISLQSDNREDIPLFGAKYHFSLADVVDCPENLVYFPLFVRMASECGMKLVYDGNFTDYFSAMCHSGRHLIKGMDALEIYSPHFRNLRGGSRSEYKEANEAFNAGVCSHVVVVCL